MLKLLIILITSFYVQILYCQEPEMPYFRLLTEEIKPLSFLEADKARGIAIDILNELFERAGSNQNANLAEFYPWARSYYIAQRERQNILFLTARTKNRETLFKWVGPVFTDRPEAFALRSRKIKINEVEDFLNYTISTYINDYQEELVLELGVPLENLDRVTNSDSRLKKVYSERSDIAFMNKIAFLNFIKRENINENVFESIYKLDGINLCFAFSSDTPDWVIEKFQKILEVLHKEGFIRELFEKYGVISAYYVEE